MRAVFIDSNEYNSSKFNLKREKVKEFCKFYMKSFIIDEIGINNLKENIVKKTKQYVELVGAYEPRYIVITGQYLGSYIRSKLLNKQQTHVIKNDLDIFVPYYSVRSNERAMGEELVLQPYVSGFDIYQPYRIHRTDKFEGISVYNIPVNIVITEHPVFSRFYQDKEIDSKKLLYMSKNIIESFDVNSVRVGVIYNIKENRFDYHISDTYIDFIFSGNITISPDVNWFKSFPRVIKKIKEFTLTNDVIKYLQHYQKSSKQNKDGMIICKIVDKNTLTELDDISINPKVYTDLDKLIKYYDLIISAVKYYNDNKKGDSNLKVKFDVVKEKKLTELYSLLFTSTLKSLGYNVNVTMNKLNIGNQPYISESDSFKYNIEITIDKEIENHQDIINDTFILKDFIDLNKANSLDLNMIYMFAKIEVLTDYVSKNKLIRINEYLESIVDDHFRIMILTNIIRSNSTNIPLGDLKIFKIVSNHDEIITVYNMLLQVLKFPQVVKILNYIESIRTRKINEISDKAIKKLAMNESINKYYSHISTKLYGGLIKIYEDFDNYKQTLGDLEKVMDKIIKEIADLKNESLLFDGFIPIKISIDNEYSIEEIINTYDLRYEGVIMKHCVGGYDYHIKNGNSCIFKIESSNDETFRYTCEINPENYSVIQCRGIANKPVDDNHKEIVDKLIDKVIDEMKKQERNELVKNKPSTNSIMIDQMQQVNIF